jgi:hypothetical protein
MTKLLRILALLGLPILALAQQNTLTTTTISSAVTSTNTNYIIVASVTGINAPTLGGGGITGTQGGSGSALFIDNELMTVISINSTSKTVYVQRGTNGTRAATHAANQLVWIGGDPTWFSGAAVGTHPQGTCTASLLTTLPDIHVLDATIWNCDSGGVWGFAGLTPGAYGAPVARTTVADAIYTALPYDSYIAYTSITTARVVTLPAANSMNGKVYTVADESGSATSMVTITFNTGHCTGVIAAYGSNRCRSNGTSWYNF